MYRILVSLMGAEGLALYLTIIVAMFEIYLMEHCRMISLLVIVTVW